ncbi:ATPase, T2SS/T4P/T4SS family [Castellaniella daejeonensis]|jgi:type II secretory ATPase GspE/PulE/Tfp pilus assembly ATPase PilB-like protein|uniref:ATPase, T2SS/T4P/T4SS family n=1 Tax=Castellaniella daejeonensis TaxID=659013 RepID=A0ABN0TF41_9BURK|nr:ATPase, T2SS/T4P/T4SS family [Castellaniella sp.]HET8704029.1 ATPase, T2SS/T4P/T4SS family [Castellaniella sp.]
MRPWSHALSLAEPPQPFDPARAGVIDHSGQLSALRPEVRRVLARDLGVQSLADRICPVERADGSVTLLARAEYVGSDQADALERRLREAGRVLSDPARYVLPAALLLALSREGGAAVLAQGGDRTPTALAGVFQDLVEWGVRQGATDLHLNIHRDAAESEVRYTVAGRYVAPERFRRMPTGLLQDVLAVAWMDILGGNGAVFDPLLEQQGSLLRRVDGRAYTLRWASLAADRGPSVCLRFLSRDAAVSPATLAGLGYRSDQIACFERVLKSEGGALVFAGTVGSGKSTTLATLIRGLPAHRKIITLEEPVEYRIDRAVQNTIGRDLDQQAHGRYAAKLRTLKRSAMTDVLLGEIRDAESGLAFMDLAGSGVNVYTTVHAPSARAIVDRLASDFIAVPRDFLATPGILKLLVYQALLPQLCARCAVPADPAELVRQQRSGDAGHWREWLGWIALAWGGDPSALRLRNPGGCAHCRQVALPELFGYDGRTVAAECLEPGLPGTAGDNGYVPDPRASAMAHAMEKAAAGLVDPRDVETRFMAFETLLLRQGRLPAGVRAPSCPAESGGHG